MLTQKPTFVLTLTACLLSLPAFGEALVVKDGAPNAEIVIAENPPRMTRVAAGELQTHIEKMSGARLGIVSRPTGSASGFGNPPEEKRFKTDAIQFWKFDKRGSPNAVYAFLRDLGVRWYMPGEIGEIIPGRPTIALPKVKKKVDAESVYGKRIALVDDYLGELRKRQSQLAKGRHNAPVFNMTIRLARDKWRKVRDTLRMDGKLDEPFWQAYPHGAGLWELITGKKPKFRTRFLARWYKDNLYFGIRCNDAPGNPAKITTTKDGDWAIWDGDHVEVSAFSPTGERNLHVTGKFAKLSVR